MDIFECEFALSIAKGGYHFLDDSILENIQSIIKADKYGRDPRLSRLNKDYENMLGLYGYSYIGYMDEDEIIDVCKKIYFYELNGIEKKDYIYLKTYQRALLVQKNTSNILYKKYNKNFEYIKIWINKQ